MTFWVNLQTITVAQKMRIPDLEAFISPDGSDKAAASPFEKFLLGLRHTKETPGRGQTGISAVARGCKHLRQRCGGLPGHAQIARLPPGALLAIVVLS